jgi:hypothetical protein
MSLFEHSLLFFDYDIKLPYLYRIVMDVLPTAALPQSTNLTAFFILPFVNTRGCDYFYLFLELKKHIFFYLFIF